MRAPCSLVSILLVALLLPATASAQDIPDDIPDSPSPRELDERREKRLKERHHATLSRLFASTKMAVAPLPGALGYGVQVAGGVQLERGGAILWATDIYQIPVKTGTSNRVLPRGDVEAFFATSLQLQLSLRRLLAPSKLANRSAVALGMGWSGGTAGNGGHEPVRYAGVHPAGQQLLEPAHRLQPEHRRELGTGSPPHLSRSARRRADALWAAEAVEVNRPALG